MQVVKAVVLRLLLAAVTCLWLWRQYSLISLSMKLHEPEPAEGHLIQAHPSKTACTGKEELLKILKDAGMKNTSSGDVCTRLPKWKNVARFYGEEPIVYGLDTCERYRALLSADANDGTAVEPTIRVAGLYNTGTNAFCHLLNYNVKDLGNHGDWEVPWQKHSPAKFRMERTNLGHNESKAHVLPVVLIREPFWWMQSMCKNRYDAKWKRAPMHCPNLVPSWKDKKYHGIEHLKTFNVTVRAKEDDPRFTSHYDSLTDLWTKWNRQYLDADYPRLIIRFEDTLFHADKVMKLVSQCAGLPTASPFKYRLAAGKDHGNSTDFVTAMAKYGTSNGRYAGLIPKDLKHARKTLDPELMSIFHYQI